MPAATLGEWHHVAMTYDGATIHFYMNGVQEAGKVRGLACTQPTTRQQLVAAREQTAKHPPTAGRNT